MAGVDSNEGNASFGYWVRRRRKALDLSQAQLAERALCSAALIRKIESDERRPSPETAELLANALEIGAAERATFLKVARSERATTALSEAPSIVPAATAQVIAPSASNLPIAATSLVGRAAELATMLELIAQAQCRLLTLVGVGGMGKTRLAIEVASQANADFVDGVFFVALAPLNNSTLIVPAIANALNCVLPSSGDPTQHLLNYLGTRSLLLVLDNAEHLLDGVAEIAEQLLATTTVKLLVTSRERLNLSSEWIFEVHGLVLPPPARGKEKSDALEQYSALQLFFERARLVMPGFDLAQNAIAVARICHLVEGLPLGIELAAAWVRILPCHEIADEIERSLDFLSMNRRDVPVRHRSMRAALDHSWALLGQDEQRILMSLASFRGGFTRAAANVVAKASLIHLSALIDKSLIRRIADDRFDLHELVRQYALLRLEETSNPSNHLAYTTARDHAAYYIALCEESQREWHGPAQKQWIDRLELEHDNLRAAQQWVLTADETEMALQLVNALWRFWWVRGYLLEGERWLDGFFAKADSTSLPPSLEMLLARALNIAGEIARVQGALLKAEGHVRSALVLHRKLGNQRGMAASLVGLGNLASVAGNYAQADAYFNESVVIDQAAGNLREANQTLNNVAVMATIQGDYVRSQAIYKEMLAYHRQQGDTQNIARCLANLGEALRYQGKFVEARSLYLDALTLQRQINDDHTIPSTLIGLGYVALRLSEWRDGVSHLQACIRLAHQVGDQVSEIEAVETLALAACLQQQFPRAATLYGAAAKRRNQVGAAQSPSDRQIHGEAQAILCSRMDETTFTHSWHEGQLLSNERVLELALASDP